MLIESGLGDLILVNVTSLRKYGNPQDIIFDASVEFAPDRYATGLSQNRSFRRIWNLISNNISLGTRLLVYDILVRHILAMLKPAYTSWRPVTPSWDKTARRPQNADIFVGSFPPKYAAWLGEIVQRTRHCFELGDQFIFVNVWTGWAEGYHLKSDQMYGRSHLEARAWVLGLV